MTKNVQSQEKKGREIKASEKWTEEEGDFTQRGSTITSLGTWNQHVPGDRQHVSVQVFSHQSRRFVGVNARANLTPEQARQLIRVLSDAVDKAEETSHN